MQHRIQDYKMLVCQTNDELEQTVIQHLKKGYELHGEPKLQSKAEDMLYCQALILRGDF